jgi:hypothetical protein
MVQSQTRHAEEFEYRRKPHLRTTASGGLKACGQSRILIQVAARNCVSAKEMWGMVKMLERTFFGIAYFGELDVADGESGE